MRYTKDINTKSKCVCVCVLVSVWGSWVSVCGCKGIALKKEISTKSKMVKQKQQLSCASKKCFLSNAIVSQ